MRATNKNQDMHVIDRRAVDTAELQQLLCCGRQTAQQIGEDAEAKIRVGRRVLWNVQRIQNYLNAISN